MTAKKPAHPVLVPKSSSASGDLGFEAKVLRLVKGAREYRAIKSGEIDAVIDPTSGHVILLPGAQAALLERKARFRSLVELSTDGYWEQDDQYRFVSHTGAAIGNESSDAEGILGKTLWELKFDNGDALDWPTHRTQLEWRAIFRDLELRCLDREGRLRVISISGEPLFDADAQFKGYRGITRDITDRQQTLTVTPASNSFACAILDALVTQVCVLDAAGTIIKSNTAWRVLAATHRGREANVSDGGNYLAACDQIVGNERVDASAMAAGIRQVIAGERELFRYEYFCDAPEQRWFMGTVTRIRGEAAARAIVSYEDITEIKNAERLLRLESATARCLADARSVPEAMQAVIRAICEAQHWECGRYFRLDVPSELLTPEQYWSRSVVAVQEFMEQSRDVQFRIGAGLAGRACQSGEPVWIASESNHAHASPTPLAHETGNAAGMSGAFVFPVIAEGKPIGVLSFAGSLVREPDDRLLQAARSIGNQVGHFLTQRQAEESLRASETRLRRLSELSSDWRWEQDSQFRYTKIVGTGMAEVGDILGKTLWDIPSIVLSDDASIKHKSELAARWSFCDFEYAALLPDGQSRYYRISGEPLYDVAGTFTGFHGIGLDITEHKRSELESREADLSSPDA